MCAAAWSSDWTIPFRLSQESRAKATEEIFKCSEKTTLKIVLRILRDRVGTKLRLSDIVPHLSKKYIDFQGYYDRFLADHKARFGKLPLLYGLAQTQQIVDTLPLGEDDVKLNGVLYADE